MSQFKVTFATVVLADLAADPRITGIVESLGAQSVVEKVAAYNSGFEFKRPAGNVDGQFIFTAGCSYADAGDSADAFAAAYGLLNTQDDCVFIYGGGTLTFADAILRAVQRVKWDGVYLQLRYTFEITTMVAS